MVDTMASKGAIPSSSLTAVAVDIPIGGRAITSASAAWKQSLPDPLQLRIDSPCLAGEAGQRLTEDQPHLVRAFDLRRRPFRQLDVVAIALVGLQHEPDPVVDPTR